MKESSETPSATCTNSSGAPSTSGFSHSFGPRGTSAAFPAELEASGLPRQFLVCLHSRRPASLRLADGEDAEDAAEDPEPAAEAPAAGDAGPDADLTRFDAVLLEPRGRPGAFVLRLRPDGSEGYVVLARGPGLEKSICEPAPDAEPVPVSPGGFFRVNGISGPAVILFRPPAPGASLLRGI